VLEISPFFCYTNIQKFKRCCKLLFLPKIYQKDIHSINYEALYKKGIRCLFFDLDNTLGLLSQTEADSSTKKLFQKLSKKFKITIISNHRSKKRVQSFANSLQCDFYYLAMKPAQRY